MNAVGVWFYSAATDRYLYVMRADPRHPGAWALPGGKIEPGETLLQAIARECQEELGAMPTCMDLVPIEQYSNPDSGFTYHTFFAVVATEFRPRLNDEHQGYAWIDSGVWPRPMHPGLYNTINFDVIQHKVQHIKENLP